MESLDMLQWSDPNALRVEAVSRLLRPTSAAIVGISSRPGSAGQNSLAMIEKDGFKGELHLVGRTGGTIGDRAVHTEFDALPTDIDLAILTLPAAGVKDAVLAAARRRVGAAVIFASGFAETGDEARQEQAEISRVAAAAGLALVGPNCLGFTNYIDRLDVGFMAGQPLPEWDPAGPAVAIVVQSGGLMALAQEGLKARALPVAYRISTGNEAGLDLADYVAFMADEDDVRTVLVYAEHIRRPAAFLAAARKCRSAGKHVVMLHTGKSEKAQHAAASHTGALAGDFAVMAASARAHGVLLVETIEELLDCTELVTRFPKPPVAGAAVITTSGAFCAIAHDCSEEVALDLPPLSAETIAFLTPKLPEFTPPNNPLDVTTQMVWEPELVATCVEALCRDPAIGSITVAVPPGSGDWALAWLRPMIEVMKRHEKPLQLALFNDIAPVPQSLIDTARDAGLPLSSSPERAIRSMAAFTHYGRAQAASPISAEVTPAAKNHPLEAGTLAEWRGKELLRSLGLPTPEGGLARTAEEAAEIAERVGFPVALKIQSAEISHKTEVGGVVLTLRDASEVREAYGAMVERVRALRPDASIDGVLIERMSGKGLEFVVGAKRDQQWGPILLFGLGGVLVEALNDVRLLPAGCDRTTIHRELRQLKMARLLDGFRGAPARDTEAVVSVIELIGKLMLERPEISEVDINPLVVFEGGQGALALDALIVSAAGEKE